jgi:high-affinity iron transporter
MNPRRPALLLSAAALASMLLALPPASAGEEGYWVGHAGAVAKAVTEAEAHFAKGDLDGAKRLLTEAYFQHFEDTKLEAAIRRNIGAKRAAQIEKFFPTIRKAMTAGDAAQVKEMAQQLREAVAADAKTLDAEKVAPGVFEVNQ